MAENMIKFLRGNVASLPQNATPGAVYFTKDEGLYLGLEDGTYHRYGDFITVANVASLPSTGAHQTCMYYCEAENVLAKWDGTEWVQINKQKTLEQLGGVAKSVYEAKVSALETADTNNSTAIANLSTYVGAIPEGATATNVIAYVQERTSGIATDTALTELSDRVEIVEGDVSAIKDDYLKSTDKTALEGKIAEAKTAGENAQSAVETLSQTHATDKSALEQAIALKANSADVYTTGDIDSKVATINAAIDNKADSSSVYNKTYIDGKVSALEGEDDRLEGLINGKVAQTAYDAKVGALEDEDERLAGLIAGNATAIADETSARTTAISGLKTELEGKIDAKVAKSDYETKVAALEGEDAKLAGLISGIDSAYKAADEDLDERIAALESDITGLSGAMHFKGVVEALPESTEGYNDGDTIIVGQKEYVVNGEAFVELGDVSAEVQRISDLEAVVGDAEDGLVKAVADNATAIATEKARAEGIEAGLAAADATNLQAAKDYADAAVTALNISQYAKDADLETAKGRITTAEGKITALETESAKHALKTEVEAVSGALTEYKNAHSGDYTNTQIDAAIEVVADDLAEYVEAHKGDYTNEQINAAIANAGHASASDLATHTGNTDIHVTTDDKAKWNAAEKNAKDAAAAALATARTEISAEIDADVLVETNRAKGVEEGLQAAINTINNADTGILAQAKSDATTKANTAETNAKSYVDGLLTWEEF